VKCRCKTKCTIRNDDTINTLIAFARRIHHFSIQKLFSPCQIYYVAVMNLQINKIDFITLPDASPICTRQKQSFYCKIFIEVINFGENFTSLLQRTFNFVSLQSIGGRSFWSYHPKGCVFRLGGYRI
jgi:hypothetical protein